MEQIELPIENLRVKQVIDFTTDGNELVFSTEIGISQPRINRLFHKNGETGNYPIVTLSIIQAIANRYKNISIDWLVLGTGSMLRSSENKESNIIGNNNIQQNHNKNIFLHSANNEQSSHISELKLKDTAILHLEEKVAYLKKVVSVQEKLINSLEKK